MLSIASTLLVVKKCFEAQTLEHTSASASSPSRGCIIDEQRCHRCKARPALTASQGEPRGQRTLLCSIRGPASSRRRCESSRSWWSPRRPDRTTSSPRESTVLTKCVFAVRRAPRTDQRLVVLITPLTPATQYDECDDEDRASSSHFISFRQSRMKTDAWFTIRAIRLCRASGAKEAEPTTRVETPPEQEITELFHPPDLFSRRLHAGPFLSSLRADEPRLQRQP